MFAQNIFTHALSQVFYDFMPTLDVIFKIIVYSILCYVFTTLFKFFGHLNVKITY